MHNHAVLVALAAAAGLLLIARRTPDPGPVYVARRSPVAAFGILLAGLGVLVYARKHQAAPAAAAPRPSVITQQVTRYVPIHNWPVSGGEITLLGLAAIGAAILIVRLLGRYYGH